MRLAHAVTISTSGRNLAEWETAETTCMLEPYKSTSLSPIDTSNGDVLLLWVLLDLLRRLWSLCTAEPVIVRRVERSSGRAARAPGTSFVVLRRALAGSPSGKASLLFDALASGVVKHRHVAVFEGEVAAVVLLDGDVLQTISATATYSKLLATKKPRRRAS